MVGNIFIAPKPSAALPDVSGGIPDIDGGYSLSYTIEQPEIPVTMDCDTYQCLDLEDLGIGTGRIYLTNQLAMVTTDNPTGFSAFVSLGSDETCMRLKSDITSSTPCGSITARRKFASVPNVQGGTSWTDMPNNSWGLIDPVAVDSGLCPNCPMPVLALPTASSGNAIEVADIDGDVEDYNLELYYVIKADPNDNSIQGGTYQTEALYTIAANPNFSNESWSFGVDPTYNGSEYTFVIPTAHTNVNFFQLTNGYYELYQVIFDCVITGFNMDIPPCSNHQDFLSSLEGLDLNNFPGDLFQDLFSTGFPYNWDIDWGDGSPIETVAGTSAIDSAGIPHNYPDSGDPNYSSSGYTITIFPAGNATNGWLNAFGSSNGSFAGGQINRINALPQPFPYGAFSIKQGALQGLFAGLTLDCEIPDDLFSEFYQALSDASTLPADIFDGMFYMTFADVYLNSNIDPADIKIPENIFQGLDASRGESFNSTFMETFAYGSSFTRSLLSPATYVAPNLTVPENLFANLDISNARTLNSTFANTFSGLAFDDDPDYTLPEHLFDFLGTANNLTSLSATFLNTFMFSSDQINNGKSITIPQGFFSQLNTSKVTDFSMTFVMMINEGLSTSSGFQGVTIPDDLFASLDTGRGTNFYGTFGAPFIKLANLPSGLFDSIDTSNGKNFTGMFCGLVARCIIDDLIFQTYGDSGNFDIPYGLLAGIDTSNGKEFYGMFYYAFHNPASIPADLFSALDTSGATSRAVAFLFYRTFAHESDIAPSANSNINDIFNGANLLGIITDPSTLDQTDNSALESAFLMAFLANSYPYLTGDATQFISDHLGGLDPDSSNSAFYNQILLDDFYTLSSYWQ
jgi:hypothetical protein